MRTVLESKSDIRDGQVVIIEKTEIKRSKKDLEVEISNLKKQKDHVVKQNERLVETYNMINERIEELEDLIIKIDESKEENSIRILGEVE